MWSGFLKMSDNVAGQHQYSQTGLLRTVNFFGGWAQAFSHGVHPDDLEEDVDLNFKYKVTKLYSAWFDFEHIRQEVDRKWSL